MIAEVAQSHDGSLGMAHCFIDGAAEAGADAVKFQTHIAAAESTQDEPWRVAFSPQDATRYDYWKRMEFTPEQWHGLAEHCRQRNIAFMSSPFSVAAVELLDRLDMPAWKIASGEVSNPELLEAVWKTKKPVLFSSGMSELAELDGVVARTRTEGIPFGVFQCTSEYPCQPERWGLGLLAELRARFGDCPVGLSDHSGNIYAGLAAAALGAELLEVHVTFSAQAFGPDVPSSVSFSDLRRLTEGVKEIRRSLATRVDKDDLARRAAPLRRIFGRSWALTEDLPAGTVLTRAHLALKKPGTGVPFEQLSKLLGTRLRADKRADRLLSLDDVFPA